MLKQEQSCHLVFFGHELLSDWVAAPVGGVQGKAAGRGNPEEQPHDQGGEEQGPKDIAKSNFVEGSWEGREGGGVRHPSPPAAGPTRSFESGGKSTIQDAFFRLYTPAVAYSCRPLYRHHRDLPKLSVCPMSV